jgi:hypothetical protein
VTPLKLFMDHWVIVNLLEKPSFAAQQERLVSLCKNGFCVLILPIWYVHEALRDSNKDRATDLCTKIEALSKQVPCLWIRLRTELQEDEVAEEFFRSMGVSYQKNNPFCEEAVAIFPIHEKLSDIEDARREGLLWFFKNPQLFGEALSEQRKYPVIKAELKAAIQTMIGGKSLFNEGKKQYVEKLLPSRYPSGLVIASESRKQFLEQINVKKFRALSFEATLSEVTNADAQAHPTEQDLVDLQHAVSLIPYVDVAVLDAKFCKYVSTVKKQWKNDQPLAEWFDSADAALDWIEKEATKH